MEAAANQSVTSSQDATFPMDEATILGRAVGFVSYRPSPSARNIEMLTHEVRDRIGPVVDEWCEKHGIDNDAVIQSAISIMRTLQTDRSIGTAMITSTLSNADVGVRKKVSELVSIVELVGEAANMIDTRKIRSLIHG